MRRPFGSIGLRPRLVILLSLAGLPGLVFMALAFGELREAATSRTQQELRRVVEVIAADQKSVTALAMRSMAEIAAPEMAQNPAVCSAQAALLTRSNAVIMTLGVADLDGTIRCSGAGSGAAGSIASWSAFQRAMATQRFTSGSVSVDPITGVLVSTYASPVWDSAANLIGIAFVGTSQAWIERLSTGLELDPSTEITILNEAGDLIARHPQPALWVNASLRDWPVARAALSETAGGTREMGKDGIERLYAFTRVQQPNVFRSFETTIVGAPGGILFGEINSTFRRASGGMAVVSFLSLLIAWYVASRWVLGPVRALIGTANRIRQGKFDSRTNVHEPGELGELAAAFDEMAASLETRRAQRDATEAQLQQAFAELRATQDQLVEQERLQAMGQMAIGFSHEFNNALSPILGYSDLLLQTPEAMRDPEKAERYLLQIRSAAEEAAAVSARLKDFYSEDAPRSASEPPPTPARRTTDGRFHILVVDDDPRAQATVVALLEHDGHAVSVAGSGEEALAAFDPGLHQLILTDRSMPGMTGDEVAASVKTLSASTPVVMLTGFGELMSQPPPGVDLVISKPPSLAKLREALVAATGSAQQSARLG